MKKNYKEAITALIGGAGVLPILMTIFMGTPEFGYAIIIAFGFFLLSGTLNGLLVETESNPGPLVLKESQKQALLSFVGGIGVIVILISLFTTSLSFGYGIVIAYGFFLLTGVFGKLIEVEGLMRSDEYRYPLAEKGMKMEKQQKGLSKTSNECHSCNGSIEVNDIFCPNCGAEQTSFA
ncbi:MAG: hypothetical protein ACXAC6_13045 [Candidatus Hodarchaeales archaeon]|jgi:hypothetical protein